MSENSLLTDGRDPGITQSNPGKVALDGPLLNGLKEKPRNTLVKKTQGPPSLPQHEGARPLYTAFPEQRQLLPTQDTLDIQRQQMPTRRQG